MRRLRTRLGRLADSNPLPFLFALIISVALVMDVLERLAS